MHTQLELRGYRVAQNREFFEVPVSHVIDLLVSAKDMLGPNTRPLPTDSHGEHQDTDSAEELFDLGNAYAEGNNDTIKNRQKALVLYEQAAALGHPLACVVAGQMYWDRDSGIQDLEKSLYYFRRAISEHSMYEQYSNVAIVFILSNQPLSAENAWQKFFQAARDNPTASHSFGGYAINYCSHVIDGKIREVVPRAELIGMKDEACAALEELVDLNQKYWITTRPKILAMLASNSDPLPQGQP